MTSAAEDLEAVRSELEAIGRRACTEPATWLAVRAVGHCEVFLAAILFAEGHEQPPVCEPEPVRLAARCAAWRAGQVERPELHARRLARLRRQLGLPARSDGEGALAS